MNMLAKGLNMLASIHLLIYPILHTMNFEFLIHSECWEDLCTNSVKVIKKPQTALDFTLRSPLLQCSVSDRRKSSSLSNPTESTAPISYQ